MVMPSRFGMRHSCCDTQPAGHLDLPLHSPYFYLSTYLFVAEIVLTCLASIKITKLHWHGEALPGRKEIFMQSVVWPAAPRAEAFPASMAEDRSWFAVFTRSHHEKRVAQYYAEREIEYLLPISRVERQWSHYRRVTLELPLFPNYLFVHIARRERTRAMEVPGALSLVGQNGVPAALPDFEIESLRETLKLADCEPHPYLVAGAKVLIKEGPLAGRTGVVLRTKNKCRVVLTMASIMRSFVVEVDAADLAAIA